jgi:hypothetical protein
LGRTRPEAAAPDQLEVETFPWGIGAEPDQNVNIGFEWGGMTDEMRKAMNARARAELDQGLAREELSR